MKKENKMKRKNELIWNEKKQRRKTKVELVPHAAKNDLWSDYPETQFGPTYTFFRNLEPKPTLRAIKVHFDWTWILRLMRFFLREFSSKIILINHPPIWDELWIFECIMGQSKKKENEKNDKEKHDSRVKTRKGSLERKIILKVSWAEQANEWRVDNQEASKASTGSPIPSKIGEFELSIQ